MQRDKDNPQLEDGYVRIANSLLEAILSAGFTQRELLVLLAIMRKTYGFNKKTDDMSASQISELCKVPRQHVTSTLISMASRNVISKSAGQYGSIIGVQKNHRKWVSADIAKRSLSSPDLGQGCPDLGQGSENDEKPAFSDKSDMEADPETAPELDLGSPESGQGCPESGHVPNWVNTCPESGQVHVPNQDTQKTTPKDTKQKTSSSSSGDDALPCPVGSLVDFYHQLMPENPRCMVLDDARKNVIRARWKAAAKLTVAPFGYQTREQGIEAWKTFFAYCAKSDFLTGKVPGREGKKPFRADIDFLFSPTKFRSAIEGKYHDGVAPGQPASNAQADGGAWRKDPKFARGQ